MQLAPTTFCGRLPLHWRAFAPNNTSRFKSRVVLRAGGSSELPPELQDLCISEDGQQLIDKKTGEVINEAGATRFDVAVRALRGEFDPPAYLENTERTSGLLLDSLTQFPAVYDFQLVVKVAAAGEQQQPQQAQQDGGSGSTTSSSSSSAGGQPEQQQPQAQQPAAVLAVLERYRRLIADTTAADIPPEACTVKERMGGKYISLRIPARVQAAHVMDLVWGALADDPAVLMKY